MNAHNQRRSGHSSGGGARMSTRSHSGEKKLELAAVSVLFRLTIKTHLCAGDRTNSTGGARSRRHPTAANKSVAGDSEPARPKSHKTRASSVPRIAKKGAPKRPAGRSTTVRIDRGPMAVTHGRVKKALRRRKPRAREAGPGRSSRRTIKSPWMIKFRTSDVAESGAALDLGARCFVRHHR